MERVKFLSEITIHNIDDIQQKINALHVLLDDNWKLWIVTNEGLRNPTWKAGGVHTTTRKVKCPICEYAFNQVKKDGCFMHVLEPDYCPKCDFPDVVFSEIENLENTLKKLKKEN